MPWKTDRTSPALEAVDGVVADGQRPLSVRTPTVTSWLTSSIMQIWGAHFLGRRSGQYLRESYPLRAPIWRPNVAGASTWKGVVGLVNNQRTCEVAAH